ncbi:hypothetical protein C0J50_12913, partial [Silurus asotus]
PGKGHIDSDTGTTFSQSLQGQFSISKHTNKNMLYAEVKSLKAEDTAVCVYCVRYHHVFSSTDVHGVELTQPASMTVQPGQSLSINCKVSYSVTSYSTHWIRQPAGKTLEWICRMRYDGSTNYNDKLKNKFSVSRDTSTNMVTIRGQNMQIEDTAVYYCAQDPTVKHVSNIPVQKHPVQKT